MLLSPACLSLLRRFAALVVLLLLGGLLVPTAASAAARPAADEGLSGRVLLQLDPTSQDVRSRVTGRAVALGVRPTRTYDRIPYLAVDASEQDLRQLRATPGVTAVLRDDKHSVSLATSTPLVGATAAWNAGFTGAGQTVAVLDSGAEASHPMLAGKIVSEACFAQSRSCPNGSASQVGPGAAAPCTFDAGACPHGTHVAGIVAGSSATLSGVARGARIAAVQVFSRETTECPGGVGPCALSWTSDLLAGLDHVARLSQTMPIAAVNMSLGGGQYAGTCDRDQPALASAITSLRSLGILTLVSSGNEGYLDSMASPACVSSAVAVGASTRVDGVATFSNSSSKLALVAPGERIVSAWTLGRTAYATGTSQAAPHVAGAVAILRQARPSATADDLVRALTGTGPAITDARNGRTVRRLQVDAALASLPAPGTPIDAKYSLLGGSLGFLGVPLAPEADADGGRYRSYAGGAIYWSAPTGARELHGAILGRWSGLGRERSPLAYPTTDELRTPDGTGRYNHFQGGSVYWTPSTGAQEVRGAIRGTWSRLGWERSLLGYPVTGELGTPDGVGRYNHFQHGSIYWTPSTGAQEVRGAIRGTWASLGWENSRLGYPVSNEYDVPGGRRSDFQGGAIAWDSRTGAVTVSSR